MVYFEFKLTHISSQRIALPNSAFSGDVDKALRRMQDSVSGFTTSFTFLCHIFREYNLIGTIDEAN
jgi:hypothetical protein